MTNSEIFQYIDYYCAHNEELDTFNNADLAYAILAHGYLYMIPDSSIGEAPTWYLEMLEAFRTGATDGFNDYLEYGNYDGPLDESIRRSMASTALKVASKKFDDEYFNAQLASMDPDEECDGSLLDKYLNLMSIEQLHDFMDYVSSCRANYGAFSSFDFGFEILHELNERCRAVNPLIPETSNQYKFITFKQKNPLYLFDHLSRAEIIDAIKRGIVWNRGLAGHLARILYNTDDIWSMDYYVELIATYERVFRRDIYDPDIFYETLFV